MYLTKEEESMLSGKYGPGVAKSMDVVVKWGEVFDAERLVDVGSTHTLLGEPAEWLAEVSEGAQVRTVSTMHVTNFDYENWEKQGVKRSWAEWQIAETNKCVPYYKSLGLLQTYTCGPYMVGNVPKQKDYINWSGTSGVIISNSVFAARAPRVGAPGSMVTAITGKAPLVGHMKEENRYGQILVQPEKSQVNFDDFSKEDIGMMSYYLAGLAGERTCVFDGFANRLSFEKCKFLASPLGVAGSGSMFHVVGFTPEAPTMEAAFGGKKPQETITVGDKEMQAGWEIMNTATNDEVDLVTFGCPHFSITEFKELVAALNGRKIKEGKRLWVSCGLDMYNLANRMGLIKPIEDAGGIVLKGCCAGPLTPWFELENVPKVVATNSTRCASYITGGTAGAIKTRYGSVKECIDSIVEGRWVGKEGWK